MNRSMAERTFAETYRGRKYHLPDPSRSGKTLCGQEIESYVGFFVGIDPCETCLRLDRKAS
jgi:hypothetical protein